MIGNLLVLLLLVGVFLNMIMAHRQVVPVPIKKRDRGH